MEYCENSLTYQDYVSLRSSVGWKNFAEEQVSKAISNSTYGEVIQPLIQQGLDDEQIDENVKIILLGDGRGIW